MKFIALMILFLTFHAAALAQDTPPKSTDDLFQKVFAGVGLDFEKFTPDEQGKLKTLIGQCLQVGKNQGIIDGYQRGSDASFAITKGLLADYYLVKKDQAENLFQEKKPSRMEKIAAMLAGFSEGYNRSAAAQRQAFIKTNCTSNRLGNYVYTNCDSTVR
jgi:hypothetical protein